MSISVVIPVYNGSRTIEATLRSVLEQTLPADEILVLDDGSTDESRSIVSSYGSRLTILHQKNQGVAAARNSLCKKANGELIAFVDQDDIWHPRYLEVQYDAFKKYPHSCAFFTWHVNFAGYGEYQWAADPSTPALDSELINPIEFLGRYNKNTGYFASMSYCCLPRAVLARIGTEPFRLGGVDDSYLCTTLPLYGPVVYTASPLVAYRVIDSAQSVNRLKMFGLWVQVFELLKSRYNEEADRDLRRVFTTAFASRRRQYGKFLMTAQRTSEARSHFLRSVSECIVPSSVAKSIALFLVSYLPPKFQPAWPPLYRRWTAPD